MLEWGCGFVEGTNGPFEASYLSADFAQRTETALGGARRRWGELFRFWSGESTVKVGLIMYKNRTTFGGDGKMENTPENRPKAPKSSILLLDANGGHDVGRTL